MGFLFRIVLFVILINFLWKIIKPYLLIDSNINEPEIRNKGTKKTLNIDKSQIEDAKFTDIDDMKDD